MRLNQTSVWKVMTIWISREVSLFNFERLDIFSPWIGHSCEYLWPFKFLERFGCSISSVSIYYAPESDTRVKMYDHLNFSRGSVVQFERLDILCSRIGHPCDKLWPLEFLESLSSSISSVSIYYAPESDVRVKSYDHLNFSRGSVVQFRASRYIKSLNRTYMWIFRTIWIPREVPLFNFQRLDILCLLIKHPFEKIGPFEFLDGFRCSISSVTLYNDTESEIRVKSYDHFNFSRGFVIQFRASRYIMS